MNATTVGVDLAKNVFVVCVADGAGRVVETREFNRAGFVAWLSTLPSGTVVGMEACGGAHCWGRTIVSDRRYGATDDRRNGASSKR